jgi:hypothetical protein
LKGHVKKNSSTYPFLVHFEILFYCINVITNLPTNNSLLGQPQ